MKEKETKSEDMKEGSRAEMREMRKRMALKMAKKKKKRMMLDESYAP